jgi:hypothetical protein
MFKNYFLPRAQAFFIFYTASIIEFMHGIGEKNSCVNSKLLIEAGEKGWQGVFFDELLCSAQEILGENRVVKLVTRREKDYFQQISVGLKNEHPSHLIFDPRSGSQNMSRALIQTFKLKILISKLNISPIIMLTDACMRTQRLQSILLAGKSGVIFTCDSSSLMAKLFNGATCIGPMPIPISQKRINQIFTRFTPYSPATKIVFTGSLYPERKIFFDELETQLSKMKSKILIERETKSESIDNDQYWQKIQSQSLIITTNFQHVLRSEKQDMVEINHMVFRVSEALAANKLLFSMKVPGMEEFFTPGTDFVEYANPRDLAEKLIYYAHNPKLQIRIAKCGFLKYQQFQTKNIYWESIKKYTKNSLSLKKVP